MATVLLDDLQLASDRDDNGGAEGLSPEEGEPEVKGLGEAEESGERAEEQME